MTRGPTGAVAPERLDRPFHDPLVRRLFPPLATGVHWGLERTEAALRALGDPHRRYASVHVGGTNGKGSVTSMVASVLRAAGVRTGCYTSPHLCSFRERMLVDGAALPEEVLLARAEEVRNVVLAFGLTFFEAATVLAFHVFAREGVQAAVVEVGLGGRLDATNVLLPEVSAVTNVALDHADYLGSTLPEIAREKGGIIKGGVPFVTAEREPELLAVLDEIARERGTRVEPLPEDAVRDVRVRPDHTAFRARTGAWGEIEVRTPLVGRHQATNAALALLVLERLPERLRPTDAAVLEGIASVEHRGRDEIRVTDGTTWLFDVAHNTAGVASLVDTIDRLDLPHPRVALVGVLGDKDWASMLPPLFTRVERAFLTQPPSAPAERRWDPAAAAEVVRDGTPLEVEEDFERALARSRAAAGRGTVIVTGSVHTVGSAMKVLGCEPLPER